MNPANPDPNGRFKIVSTGDRPTDVRVFSPSGEDVSNAVCSVKWEADPREGVKATIVVLARCEIEVSPELVEITERIINERLSLGLFNGNDKV